MLNAGAKLSVEYVVPGARAICPWASTVPAIGVVAAGAAEKTIGVGEGVGEGAGVLFGLVVDGLG
jgi:hypothetical protein